MKEDTTPIDPTWMAKTGGFARDMTLHDWYAGLAMQSLANDESYKSESAYVIAMDSLILADAMLKAREEK
jgi:hypothetical protein